MRPGRTGRLWRKLLFRELWSVGVADVTPLRLLAGETIPPPRWLLHGGYGQFSADPFPVVVGGQPHVLFETWSTLTGRGWIATQALDGHAATAIDLGIHASYPAIFEYEGETFCAPEMWEGGGLRIFRLGASPTDWTLVAHVLHPIPIVDPTIFQHAGRWWLFATIRGQSPDADLYAWFADSPFGPWSAHRANPIKSDIGSARPAGAVFYCPRGVPHRPAQDCAAGYGAAVVINRIDRLDPDGFQETTVRRIVAPDGWLGIHTINACGGGVLIDAKRRIFDPLAVLWTAVPHIRRVMGIGRTRLR